MKQARCALRTSVAAILLSSVAVTALASTQANLSLSGFSYTLKDLNTNDGVTPALTFLSAATVYDHGLDLQQAAWSRYDGVLYTNWNFSQQFNDASILHLSSSTSQGQADVRAGADGLETLTLNSTSSAATQNSTSATYTQGFQLSAGSQVTFRYVVDAAFSGTTSTGMWTPEVGSVQSLHSSAGFSTSITVGVLSTNFSGSGFNAWQAQTEAYENVVDGQIVQLTLRNTGSVARNYQVSIDGSVSTSEVVLAVPEPASYALMALGLLAVGGALRRRR